MAKLKHSAKYRVRNQLAILLTILSFVAFVPGISLSMLKLNLSGSIDAPIGYVSLNFFDTSNSILKTVDNLYHRNNKFVAIMIFLFSIVVPITKGILFGYVLVSDNPVRKKILAFTQAIGKWSMCDVFVVATFLAYLSTSSSNKESIHETTILGFSFEYDVSVAMHAKLQVGFYFFLAYCLLSLISFQLYSEKSK